MDLDIDRQAPVPVVQQVVSAIIEWIGQNKVAAGTRLPSIRQLARDNFLSQTYVVEAYERLVAQGVLASRNGSSFIVAHSPEAARGPAAQEWYEGLEANWGEFSEHPLGELKLGCGWIPEGWRESDDIGYAIRQISRTQMHGVFSYSTALGLPALREQLHKHLLHKGIPGGSEQILTTQGVTQALDLLVRVLLKPGDRVLVETPAYPNLYNLLKLHGLVLLEVPRTRHGPDLEVLRERLLEHRPRYFFLNSACHNPTGTSLNLALARQLLQLAQAHDLTIIEDAVCNDFQGGQGTQLAALDSEQRVIHVSGFSKTLSSSLRLGFVRAPEELIQRLAEVKMTTSLGVSRFSESVIAVLLANGAYRKLVQRLRQRLNAQRVQVLDMLERAEWQVFAEPAAGMFIWARSPRYSPAQVQACARKLGVLLAQEANFVLDRQDSGWMRINVAYASDPRAQKLVRMLGSAESTSASLKTTPV